MIVLNILLIILLSLVAVLLLPFTAIIFLNLSEVERKAKLEEHLLVCPTCLMRPEWEDVVITCNRRAKLEKGYKLFSTAGLAW